MEINPLTTDYNISSIITDIQHTTSEALSQHLSLPSSLLLSLLSSFNEIYITLLLMIITALYVVVTGSIRAFKDTRHSGIDLTGILNNIDHISISDAASFPIAGSVMLFTLYVVLKYIPASYVSVIISFYISMFSMFAVNVMLRSVIGSRVRVVDNNNNDKNNNDNNNNNNKEVSSNKNGKQKEDSGTTTTNTQDTTVTTTTTTSNSNSTITTDSKNNSQKKENEKEKEKEENNNNNNHKKPFCSSPLLKSNILVGITSILLCISYIYTKHWILNNILAISVAILAVESRPVGSFKVGATLLCGLFIYDIFWVFGTDVMVTVAMSVDGPIKIVYPQTMLSSPMDGPLSLLGLGDIIIPGFYIVLMGLFSLYGCNEARLVSLKITDEERYGDRDKAPKGSLFYFYTAIIGYLLSLINTMVVMVVYKHAQPALLYIVPWLLITTMIVAAVKGDVHLLFTWSIDDIQMYYLTDMEKDEVMDKRRKEEELKKEEEAKSKAVEGDIIIGVLRDFFGFV